jgi:phage-related tail fiber protein
VRIATTANDSLSGLAARDGVTPVNGDRVAVIANTTGAQNGIYIAASGAWSRATDADGTGELTAGMAFFVSEGTTNGNTQWKLTTDDPITIGTTALVFAQIGAGTSYTNGTGIGLSGNVFSLDRTLATTGYSATFGDATSTSFNVDHNLNSVRKLVVSFVKESNGEPYVFDWTYSTANRIIVTAPIAPASNEFRVNVFAIT